MCSSQQNHIIQAMAVLGAKENPQIRTSFVYSSEKMSSSTDDSDELVDPLAEELRNIQSVIHVTRENIDALNAKFANLQEPPPLYITEYQELTSKLHELELKEHELVDRVQQNEEPTEPPELQPEEHTEVSAPISACVPSGAFAGLPNAFVRHFDVFNVHLGKC